MKRPGNQKVAVARSAMVPRTECAGYQKKPMLPSGNSAQLGKHFAISLALTWDGARWPTRSLPPKARAFLAGQSHEAKTPSAREMAELFADDQVSEIRICWVPRLEGGDDVLTIPFQTPEGMRLGFKSVKTIPFGDMLGVVYQRK